MAGRKDKGAKDFICPQCGRSFRKIKSRQIPREGALQFCDGRCKMEFFSDKSKTGIIKVYLDGVRVQQHKFSENKQLKRYIEYYFEEYGLTTEISVLFD